MTTLLLVVIYISFIGLGIPDSLFGTAWPAIYADFSLPLSYGSFVTVIVSCGTVISSLISGRLIERFGTSRVAAFSTALTAVALLGFSVAPGLWVMCLLAIPLGIGAGAVDVALNNYVALHYSATHMSFLHCFYGVGVAVSPYILSLVIGGTAGWRGGYRVMFGVQMAITALLFVTLPLWKKVGDEKVDAPEESTVALNFWQALKLPGVKLMCSLFVLSCAIEYSCGNWGSTFLVEYKFLSPERAAWVVMLYYVGMALGRFLSGVLAARFHSWTIIRMGEIVLGVAVALLFLPGQLPCTVGMLLVGLGNGPLFPNFNYLTPENFGGQVSQSVMGVQMAMAYVGIMLGPLLCGLLGQALGMQIFPVYVLVLYVLLMPLTVRARKMLRK